MKSSLADSILTVCRTLNKFSIEYIIVGGAAVALHGYYRQSMNVDGKIAEKPDLDFWYNPTYDNYFRLLNALEELGQDVIHFKGEQKPNPKKSFFRDEFEKFTLDFLPELKVSLRFRQSCNRKETVTLKDIAIPFISYEDLILDKKANGRSKDIIDIENSAPIEKERGVKKLILTLYCQKQNKPNTMRQMNCFVNNKSNLKFRNAENRLLSTLLEAHC